MSVALGLRADFERIRAARREGRSAERLAAHYAVEKRLAIELASAGPRQRPSLYSDVYRRLFEALPDHPQHHGSTTARQARIAAQVRFLRRWLRPDSTYVEIGCGDAALTKSIAPFVAAAVGIDVTPVLVDADGAPPTFRFLATDGTGFELAAGSADLVYSNQLMEHLHPDDALAQLQEVFRVLRPGGRYICVTPNRLTGPHDISCYFQYQPAGLHLREYDHRSLGRLFRQVGFARVFGCVTAKGRTLDVPIAVIGPIEAALEALPSAWRMRIALNQAVTNLAGVTLIGVK